MKIPVITINFIRVNVINNRVITINFIRVNVINNRATGWAYPCLKTRRQHIFKESIIMRFLMNFQKIDIEITTYM